MKSSVCTQNMMLNNVAKKQIEEMLTKKNDILNVYICQQGLRKIRGKGLKTKQNLFFELSENSQTINLPQSVQQLKNSSKLYIEFRDCWLKMENMVMVQNKMYKKRKKKIQRLLYNTISNRAYLAMPRTEEKRGDETFCFCSFVSMTTNNF